MMFPQVLAPTQVRIIGAELNLALGLFGSMVGPAAGHITFPTTPTPNSFDRT